MFISILYSFFFNLIGISTEYTSWILVAAPVSFFLALQNPFQAVGLSKAPSLAVKSELPSPRKVAGGNVSGLKVYMHTLCVCFVG